MNEIAELEGRLTAALERIAQGVERRLNAPVGPSASIMAELDRLREELDEERMANAQLMERLKVQRERAERSLAEIRAEAERLSAQVDEQALALQRLTQANVQMREETRRLGAELAEGGQVDPARLDKLMAAELQAERALRAAEEAALADLAAALAPIVEAEEGRAHA